MRIVLHVGPEPRVAMRLQAVMAAKRRQMAAKGVLFAETPGRSGHGLLAVASGDEARPGALAASHGILGAGALERLRADLARGLAAEVARHAPDTLILSSAPLASLDDPAIGRLMALLRPLSDDITVIAHWDDPARLFLAHYAEALGLGRRRSPVQELSLAETPDLRAAAFATWPDAEPAIGVFPDVDGAPPWLDLPGFLRAWSAHAQVVLRATDRDALWSAAAVDEVRAMAGLSATLGRAEPAPPPALPPAAWLTRCRRFNDVLARQAAIDGFAVPVQARQRMLQDLAIDGPPIDPGALSVLSRRFATDRAALVAQHPGLAAICAPPEAADWHEAPPERGFRATQYLLAFQPRIARALKSDPPLPPPETVLEHLTEPARKLLPEPARRRVAALMDGPYAPHDALGPVLADGPRFPKATPRGRGRVIVACMKNEAPYLLEWIAHHRAIGFDGFVIYTNDCDDGTDAMLDRLQAMGIVAHRDNSGWTGRSPQQFALDRALSEPLVQSADWVAHIDVDEFVNVHCGDGTLDALFDAVPDATHVALPWRLFGHGGVRAIEDRPVTAQFTRAAPRWCPKPHTVWGFKTLGRNLGVYGKLACHRPSRPDAARLDEVRWVNGSGRDVTQAFARKGWRASQDTIGYDLVQLNHYALRSLDAFLVKRARGRALHVDRQIGLNYWIRMDWSDCADRSILRNADRVDDALAALKADPVLARLHAAGLAHHRARAEALRADPGFAELARAAADIRLAPLERVAWALTLDTES